MDAGVGDLRRDRPAFPTPPSAGNSRRPRSALRVLASNHSLVRLVLAFAGVTLAEWAYVTTLSIHAYRTNGAIAVGIVGARLFLAAVSSLFNPSGVRRPGNGRNLSEIAGLRGALVAASAALATTDASLAPLLALLGLDAVVSAQYRPAQSAMIPALSRSPQEVMITATALSTAKTLSQAIGAVMGGTLLAFVSPQVVFVIAATVFGLAAVSTVPLWRRSTSTKVAAPESATRDTQRGRFAEMFGDLRNRNVGGVLVASGLRTFVRGMWVAVAVIAALKLLDAGSAGVGLLMLAAGIGSLIAAPVSSWLVTRWRIGTPAAMALLSCGIPLAVIAWIPRFDLSLVLVAVWGVGMAVSDVATSSILFRLVETPLLPRVTSTIESAKLALEGLGGFLAPILAVTINVRAALLVASVPLPLLVAGGWKTLHRVDATAAERAGLLDMLHRIQCLEPLNMGSLDSLITRLKPSVVTEPGWEIIRQGEEGDSFHIIMDGSAEVLIDGYVVNILEKGQGFGEKALLRNSRRSATVRTLTSMQLLSLDRDDFLDVVTGGGEGSEQSQAMMPLREDHGVTLGQRLDYLAGSSLFYHVDPATLKMVAEQSRIDHWSPGTTIVHQGDEGDRYFLVLDGRAEVTVDGRRVNEILPGDHFGEIALLHSVPRSASVIASTPLVSLSLHRDDFPPAVRARLSYESTP